MGFARDAAVFLFLASPCIGASLSTNSSAQAESGAGSASNTVSLSSTATASRPTNLGSNASPTASVTSSASFSSTAQAVSRNASITAAAATTSLGFWEEICANNGPPCTAYCSPGDSGCQQSVRSIIKTCAPSWSSYSDVVLGEATPGPGWSETTVTSGGYWTTWTVSDVVVYTSFSTSSTLFVGAASGPGSPDTTFEPVYALGAPFTTVSLTTESIPIQISTLQSAPTPTCTYIDLATTIPAPSCGQCTIEGGTVELFYWPGLATEYGANITTPTATLAVTDAPSTVLDGTTLVSPTVYISFETVFASDHCSRVGQQYEGTMLAMRPQDVSTQVNLGAGGMVWANSYSRLNYADLTGVVPASVYEVQPDCQYVACLTIYPDYNPTIKVPEQIRSLDPAWAKCALAIEGLYDPPTALTPQATADAATVPAFVHSTTASPQSSPTASSPQKTGEPDSDQAGTTTSPRSQITKPPAVVEPSASHHSNSQESDPVVVVHTDGIASYIILGAGGKPSAGHDQSVRLTELSSGVFVAGGQTLATDSPVTFDDGKSSLTVNMVVSGGDTFVELGTTRTLGLGDAANGASAVATYTADSMTFTADQNGDILLAGATLAPGEKTTVGSGSAKTVIQATSVSGHAAVIVDGTLTASLHKATAASSSDAASNSASSATDATTNLQTDARPSASPTATPNPSGADRIRMRRSSIGVAFAAAMAWLCRWR